MDIPFERIRTFGIEISPEIRTLDDLLATMVTEPSSVLWLANHLRRGLTTDITFDKSYESV